MWIAATGAEALIAQRGWDSDLTRIFFANVGHVAHKWLHFFPVYERYFARFRNTPVRMLEIGVYKGGSLNMWRQYLGPDAKIFGIDINPECVSYASPPNRVLIGSQADPKFLRSTVDEMGGVDLILDDGSHVAAHQKCSFETLFPLLS